MILNIYKISYLEEAELNLTDAILNNSQKILDLKNEIEKIKKAQDYLKKLSIDDLLFFFDSISTKWLKEDSAFLSKFSIHGITFLVNFLKRVNLEPLVNESFRNNKNYLDTFIFSNNLKKMLMCQPKGIVTHWLSGNVAILGIISLIQGIITKNANIVKLPRENGMVLPEILQKISSYSVTTPAGVTISGGEIIKSILTVYCNKDDKSSQKSLSDISNVRIAWGGKEAVESILSIPRRYETDDVIFGPKYSFIVIGKNCIKESELDEFTFKIALDASIFDQYGCNSPHTIFVERNSNISQLQIAESLAKGMEKALKRIPKLPISPDESFSIASIRSEYALEGKVFKSDGTDWTVISSEDSGFANPCFSRVLFVRPIDNINAVLPFINHGNQTLGLLIDSERKIEFAIKATEAGIERITDLGKMTLFSYPWDGMFPMEKLVRWVSLD